MKFDILKRRIVYIILLISIGLNIIMGIELYNNQLKKKSCNQVQIESKGDNLTKEYEDNPTDKYTDEKQVESREDNLTNEYRNDPVDEYIDEKQIESRGDNLTNEYKNNPIDKYIDERLAGDNMTYAEIRDIRRLYFMLWKSEYDNVINFLKANCENNEDKSAIKKLDREIEIYVEKMSDVYEINYDNLLGLSFWADIMYNKGEIYRDICMHLIEMSNEEYVFLEKDYDKIVIP